MTDPVRILVAEDEVSIQQIVEEALADGEFEADIAPSGGEALSASETTAPDIAPCSPISASAPD